MESFRTESQLDPTDADVSPIDHGLHSYNQQAADLAAIRRFACYARSPEGALVGGALARWWGTACELQQLWVDEALRRRGIGALLMQRVEATAIERGCRLIYLDTFSFQAPEFLLRSRLRDRMSARWISRRRLEVHLAQSIG